MRIHNKFGCITLTLIIFIILHIKTFDVNNVSKFTNSFATNTHGEIINIEMCPTSRLTNIKNNLLEVWNNNWLPNKTINIIEKSQSNKQLKVKGLLIGFYLIGLPIVVCFVSIILLKHWIFSPCSNTIKY